MNILAEENDLVFGDTDNPEEDKTSENNEYEETEEEDEEEEEEKSSSEIAQKIKYREKFKSEKMRAENLEKELDKIRNKDIPEEDKEAQAKKYIRDVAKEAYREILDQEKMEKETTTEKFQEELDQVLDDNPDLSEKKILDICKELEVKPAIAAKILNRSETKKAKPNLPTSQRGTGKAETKKYDDKGKDFFQIAREAIKDYKQKTGT
uniref:Scaffolding protein n=1 Tax=viral metagenome TaxID=1070528 RepID=A0A6H1ZUB0_9ZZZZ